MIDSLIRRRFVPESILYDGTQIRSLWAYNQYQIQGDSIVSFIGPCDIPTENIVDCEDVLTNQTIYSDPSTCQGAISAALLPAGKPTQV